MVISEKLYKELLAINEEINYILKSNIVTDYRLEKFLKNFEKSRYNMLSEIKLYNNTVDLNLEKITTIDSDYKCNIINNYLHIYIPETMPFYKNIKTHSHKRILLNVAEITKQYKGFFKDNVFIFIKIFDKTTGWDIDNRFIKPICDGLILSGVIQDDNINKMFYCVKGDYSDFPHTEIFIYDAKNIKNFETLQ